MFEPGHNNPPSMIHTCDQVAEEISGWLADHPAISNEEEAREAKVRLDRGKLNLKDMEDERDKAVRPLNEQVKTINEAYRPTRLLLGKIIEEVTSRLSAYIKEEERKREEEAREAARIAREAEQRAIEAELAEQAAIAEANSGVLDVDIKAAVVVADSAYREYEKAERQAQVAEKDAHVKVGGGLSRATSLRTVETLIISNIDAAISALGLTDDIREAILKSARAYRKVFGELPDGVEAMTERKI